jgi:hypothetical protein
MTPEIHYERNGEINIAYQVVGTGPRDLILAPCWPRLALTIAQSL